LNGAGDTLPVLATYAKGSENEKVERALQQFGAAGVVLG
jgi:hypothetical protein